MINIYNYSIFSNNKSPLKETSKDDANKRDIRYMTNSEIEVIDFDMVKNDYIKDLKLGDTPKSNDALLKINNELYFIEFKNGNMKKEIYNVKRKIFDSLLILTDIINKGISYTRENLNYILVYNNEYSISRKDKLDKAEVQDAKGFDQILRVISYHAENELDIFGLRKQFEKLYFKKVHTYTPEEFEEKFVKQYESDI